jgi:hypothetical protein
MSNQSTASNNKIDGKPHKISKKSLPHSGNGAERFNMISDAAYYRALGRGFDGGDSMEDWLMAESEIDGMSH